MLAGSAALKGAWHFDDYHTIVNNDPLRNPGNILRSFWDPGLFSADPARKMYRPALQISYILNFLLTGEDVRGFLLINLLLHLSNAVMVWAIARKLMFTGWGAAGGAPAGEELGALIAGLVYAVHPAATEGIAYASARSAVLATTFTLGSFLAYIRYDRRGSPAALIIAAVLFIFGIGAKAIAIFLPAAVVMYHLWFSHEGGIGRRKAIAGVGFIGALAIGYVVLRRILMGVILAESLVRPLQENIQTQARAYMHYFRLFLWPIHQSINPFFPTFPDLFDPQVIASIFALAGLLVVIAVLRMRGVSCHAPTDPGGNSPRLISFGLLWILVSLLPESSIVPLNLVVTERRMILPLVGYSLVLGAVLGMAKARKRAVIAILLILSLSALTVVRLREWRSEERVWSAAVRVDPNWGLLWNNLGLIYIENRNTLRGLQMFELAARHDPMFKEARLNLGQLYAQNGQNEQAEGYYQEALALDPGYVKAAVALAQLWDRADKRAQAREYMRQFAEKYPASRALYLLGAFEEDDGNPETAMGFYYRAVADDPFDPLPNLALSRLLATAGRREKALDHVNQFLKRYTINDSYRQEALRLMSELSLKH